MTAGTVAQNLAYTLTLLDCLAVPVIYSVSATVVVVSPTRVASGARDATLVRPFRVGVTSVQAVATTLTLRVSM